MRNAATAALSLTVIIVLPGCTTATSRPTATANPTATASPIATPTIRASGIGADGGGEDWGEQLFVHTPDGQRRQIPWQGIYTVPNTLPPDEPPIAW